MSSLEFVCKQLVGILDARPKLCRGQETNERTILHPDPREIFPKRF